VSEEKQATGQEPGAEGARTDSIFASQPPSRAETSSEEESSSSEASEPAPGPGRSHRKQEQGELPGAQPEGKASSLTGREELPEEKGPSRNASEQSSEKYHGEGERAGSEPTHEERSSKERSASTQGNVGHGAGATTHRKAGKRGAREDAPGSHAPSESGTEAGTPEGRNEPATPAREEEPSSEKSEKGATPPKKTTLPSEQSAGGEEEEATATVRTTEEADDQPQEEMGSEAGGEALASSGSDEVATEKADTGVAGGEAGDTEEEDLGAPVEAEVRAQPEKEREVTPQPGTSASQETGHRIDLPDVTPPGEEAEEAGVGEIALLMRRFHEAQRWYAEASKLGGEAVGKGSLRAEQMRDAAEAKYGVPGHTEAKMQSRIIQRGGLTAAERDVLVEELADATKQAAMPALKEVRGEIRSVRNGRERLRSLIAKSAKYIGLRKRMQTLKGKARKVRAEADNGNAEEAQFQQVRAKIAAASRRMQKLEKPEQLAKEARDARSQFESASDLDEGGAYKRLVWSHVSRDWQARGTEAFGEATSKAARALDSSTVEAALEKMGEALSPGRRTTDVKNKNKNKKEKDGPSLEL